MNGSVLENGSFVDRRPIITCAGELEVFSTLEDKLSQALPQDWSEWRRPLGRPVRTVHIGANFAPFSPAALPKSSQWDLIRQPLFHIYWTECVDMDLYKATVKDDIELWLKELSSRDINDWLIVVVENYDGKRTNKLLPRTTVLDKIRTDFAPKQGDKCISVINPGKVESKSADSWRGLMERIRHLTLVAYARAVSKLEDHVRQQRERRNEVGWNFMEYFKLQEELAQVLEMLSLYDEALVQYDELDALLSQFVVNGHVTNGDVTNWLNDFQCPLERWHGLKLGPSQLPENSSILELRAYLFGKQAHMLLLTDKIWEVASRCLPFLHNCVRELNMLEVSASEGAVSCWLFLACMEVLQHCEKFNQADQVEAYSLNTACLWSYASQKLRDLGVLCGLMPGGNPTSEQLHIVVGLSAGMGDNPGLDGTPSPTDRLKEALCSKDAFNKNYLELAELALGTYKHIGRLRSARLVGIELASFYLLLGETQKSAAFLNDGLKTFEQNNWRDLVAQTHINLAECYKCAGDSRKFVRSCTAVCSSPEVDNLVRWTYFEEMMRGLSTLSKSLIVPFKDTVKIINVNIQNEGAVMLDGCIKVDVVLESNFPREVVCGNVVLSLEVDRDQKKEKDRKYSSLNKSSELFVKRLKMQRLLNYNEDKQLHSANVVCKNSTFKRMESSTSLQSDFSVVLKCNKYPMVLKPGLNTLRLIRSASAPGKYYLGQVAIHVGKMELISPQIAPKIFLEVKHEEPTIRLDKGASPLLSGLEQTMSLTVTIGSYKVEPGCAVELTSSEGLRIGCTDDVLLSRNVKFEVTHTEPFSSTTMVVRVLADIMSTDHQVVITSPWSSKPISVALSFTSPLSASMRLHTVKHRKFIWVNLVGQRDVSLFVDLPKLSFGNDMKVVDYNIPLSQVISSGLCISYMWEVQTTPGSLSTPLKGEFSVQYSTKCSDLENGETGTYRYCFDITDYQTLYHVEAHIEPTKGNEFCRVGGLCHLHLSIKPAGHSLQINVTTYSLMYEVLAEPSVWAVCGRTAGVVSFASDPEPQTVILDVMPLNSGFLPLPVVRLSKYIPAEFNSVSDKIIKQETHPRLEPFSNGQVYNASKGLQVHVIAAINDVHVNT